MSAQKAPPSALAPSSGVYLEAVEGARQLAFDFMERMGTPGLSVAVGLDGEIVWAEGFGYADLENRVSVWPSTKFRIASISKPLTAAAIGKLVEGNRLDLDAPIQRYVPSFPEKPWPITMRQLGGHLAGIRHYRGSENLSRIHYDDVLDALEIFSADPLVHQPGTEYLYSSYGWNLISAVIQEAAGEPFLDYMRQEVFDPLAMNETVAEHVDSLIYHRASFYLRGDDGRIINAPYVDISNKWAGGGFLSTASDLVRFGWAHLGGNFLAPETLRLFWTSQKTLDGRETGYGIGWSVMERDGRRVVYHTGGATGGSDVLVILPEEGIVVAILTNLSSERPTETALAIASLFASVSH
ncbi:MAG: serine hydrolase domain-containing protein [Gemmatimonadota bacterium]